MARPETFYERLGVDTDASEADVERAYRERVKQCHPDVSDHPDARERLRRVNRARAVLTDATERARYDRLGHVEYRRREGSVDGTGADGTGADGGAPSDRSDGDDAGRTSEEQRGRRRTTTSDAGRGRGRGRETDHGRTRTETGHGRTGTERRTRRSDTSGSSTGDTSDSGGLGRFALGEAVGAVALGLGGAGLLVLVAFVASRGGLEGRSAVATVSAAWLVVALVAGRLAGRLHPALPDEVVRAHAFPLVLLVGAFYAAQLGRSDTLVAALAAYGLFTALFRTAALVAAPGDRTLRAAAVWFLGTLPAALVAYVGYAGAGAFGRTLRRTADAVVPAIPGVAAVAVAAPVTVVVGHAVWRLCRTLRRVRG